MFIKIGNRIINNEAIAYVDLADPQQVVIHLIATYGYEDGHRPVYLEFRGKEAEVLRKYFGESGGADVEELKP